MIRITALALLSAAMLAVSPAARAALLFEAFLDGPSEAPPNASPGTGHATFLYDDVAHTLAIEAMFADLIGTTTVAHIHAPTADPFDGTVGVAVTPGTLPGFPVGVTAGTYNVVLDLTQLATYTAGFLALGDGTAATAEALLLSSFEAGRAYFNVHTNVFPGGEIRGFLVPVPEPAAAGLLVLALGGLLYARRRTKP